MFGEYLLFLFLASLASNYLIYESYSMPNEDDLIDVVDDHPVAVVAVELEKVSYLNGNDDSALDKTINGNHDSSSSNKNSVEETKSNDPKSTELSFEPIAFAFQNITYKVKINEGKFSLHIHL